MIVTCIVQCLAHSAIQRTYVPILVEKNKKNSTIIIYFLVYAEFSGGKPENLSIQVGNYCHFFYELLSLLLRTVLSWGTLTKSKKKINKNHSKMSGYFSIIKHLSQILKHILQITKSLKGHT